MSDYMKYDGRKPEPPYLTPMDYDSLVAQNECLAAELAEAQRHSDWQTGKIASLQDKVDVFFGVYSELVETRRQLEDEREKSSHWEQTCTLYADERNYLRDQLIEAHSSLDKWREIAERRGDEIKRMYTEASNEGVANG